jgi:hypothetical protein
MSIRLEASKAFLRTLGEGTQNTLHRMERHAVQSSRNIRVKEPCPLTPIGILALAQGPRLTPAICYTTTLIPKQRTRDRLTNSKKRKQSTRVGRSAFGIGVQVEVASRVSTTKEFWIIDSFSSHLYSRSIVISSMNDYHVSSNHTRKSRPGTFCLAHVRRSSMGSSSRSPAPYD